MIINAYALQPNEKLWSLLHRSKQIQNSLKGNYIDLAMNLIL